MKITVLSLWANKLFRPEDPQPFGGAELQLALLAEALAKYPEVTVQFITRGQGIYETFEHQGIQVQKLPYRDNALSRSALGTLDILRQCLNLESDVILQRAGGIETGLAAWAARRKNIPFVFMSSSLRDTDGAREKKMGPLLGRMYLYGLRHARSVIVQTEEQQDALKRVHGIDSVVLRSAHEIPADLPEKSRDVLWVGRCEPGKRPDLFLQLVESMPNTSFTMVCPKANSETLFQVTQRDAGNLPNLRFLPGIPFDETERLFAQHRLYVNTSEHEGFPNTFVQACKWGTPILSLFVDPDSRLSKHHIGLHLQGDSQKLQDAVESLLRDESERRRIAENARTYAQEHHNRERIAGQLLEIMLEAGV